MTHLKMTLFIIAALTIASTHAQNGYSARLSANMGGGKNTVNNLNGRIRTKSDVSTLCLLTAGYTFSKLRISAGLGLSGTSYTKNYQVLFESDFDPVTGQPKTEPTDITRYSIYRHLMLPVTIGCMLPVTRKIVIVPEFGLLTAYNFPVIIKNKNQKTKETTSYKNAAETAFSLSGIVALNVEYYLTNQVGLTGGVAYTQSLTNLLAIPNSRKTEYTYGAGIGVVFRFNKKTN